MEGHQYAESVVALPDGGAAVTWVQAPFSNEQGASKLFFRSFDELDSPDDSLVVARNPQGTARFGGLLAANSSGNLVLGLTLWRLIAKRFNFTVGPTEVKLDVSRNYSFPGLGGLAMDSKGDFVATWDN
jgi:hypothetical protein